MHLTVPLPYCTAPYRRANMLVPGFGRFKHTFKASVEEFFSPKLLPVLSFSFLLVALSLAVTGMLYYDGMEFDGIWFDNLTLLPSCLLIYFIHYPSSIFICFLSFSLPFPHCTINIPHFPSSSHVTYPSILSLTPLTLRYTYPLTLHCTTRTSGRRLGGPPLCYSSCGTCLAIWGESNKLPDGVIVPETVGGRAGCGYANGKVRMYSDYDYFVQIFLLYLYVMIFILSHTYLHTHTHTYIQEMLGYYTMAQTSFLLFMSVIVAMAVCMAWRVADEELAERLVSGRVVSNTSAAMTYLCFRFSLCNVYAFLMVLYTL